MAKYHNRMKKKCTKCNVEKKLDEFGVHPDRVMGRQSWCKECYAAYKKKRKDDTLELNKMFFG